MPAAPQPGEGGSFIPFTPFSGDDIWRWQVGAAFERLIFQPEPSHLEASETDGQAQRPTERERRSQDVEIELATAFFDLFSRSASWDLCAFDDGQMRARGNDAAQPESRSL